MVEPGRRVFTQALTVAVPFAPIRTARVSKRSKSGMRGKARPTDSLAASASRCNNGPPIPSRALQRALTAD
jgi:hypothetical protein